jgi:hypothetical protein
MSTQETIPKELNTILAKAQSISLVHPSEISTESSVVNDLTDAYDEYNQILTLINNLQLDLNNILKPHLLLQEKDEKYENIELTKGIWLLDNLKDAQEELENCANDLSFIISEIEVGDDIDSNDFLVYEYEIGNFVKIMNKTIQEYKS